MSKLKVSQGLFKALILMNAIAFLHQSSQGQDTTGFLTSGTTSICLGDTATLNAGTVGADYGDGSDGALTVGSGTAYTDALRTGVTGTNVAGSSTLTVSSSSGFSIGDEIIIITMVDANPSGNTTGKHEFNIITAISGNTFTLANVRTNAFNASGTQIHQAIKVPNYTNVSISAGATLTCNTWDGSTGGVLCFRANGTLTNAGTITSSGKGYRGVGHNAVWRNKNGAQGEGIYGTGFVGGNSNGSNSVTWNGANGNGGGGGTGRQDSGGGAGGGYASNGTNGTNQGSHFGGTGGLSVGTANLELLIMGGAGGEGGGDEDGQKPGYGGDGGGIIYISASVTQNSGTITCNGQNGGNGTGGGCGMGGGGGGAGGSIKLISVFSGNGTITSLGGNAGTPNGCGGLGGSGSLGRIALASTIASYPTTSPVPATASLAVITGSSYAWSNGDTTSFIQVSPATTTTYTVTISNGNWADTLSQEIYVFGVPNMPVGLADIEHCAGTFTFNATTDSLIQTVWYDTDTGGTPIYYGNEFTTPFLNDTTTYYYTSQYVTYTPPTDAVDNSMQLALGLRLLVSDYEGKAVILRKSATANDTASFGFNFLGQLDSAAINAWAGAASTLWVHTIFDQSGNGRNLLNTNTGQQPQLILSGENGKPVLRFVTGTFLRYTTNDIVYPMSIVTAAKLTTNSCGRVFGAANNYIYAFYSNQVNRHHFNTWVSNSGTNMVAASSSDTWIHSSMSASNTSHRFFDNGNEWPANTINNANSQPPNGFQLNGYAANNQTSNVDIMEVFIFDDVITDTEREYIEGRIASQYNWQTAGGQVVDAAAPCLLSNPNIDSVRAIVTAPSFGFNLDTITANCIADSILIDAGAGWQTYSWSNLDTTQICTARYSGTYNIVVNDGSCDVTDSVFVSLPKPVLDDFTICNGDTITAGYLSLGGFAAGGILDTIGQEAVHKFLTDGTLVFPSTTQVRALIVGGGGGGGMDMGGGGGAGGFIDTTFILPAGSYNISVGQGGTGAPAAGTFGQPGGHQYSIPALNGGNSSIGSLLAAIGGGAGGTSYWPYTPQSAGSNGGSGGGSSGYGAPNGSGAGLGTAGQGNRGGHGAGSHRSGGGGGAGSQGGGGPNGGSYNANGGAGLQSDVLGTTYYFAGGGGGSGYSTIGGNGGIGGGGGGAVGTTTGGAGLNNGSPGGGGNTNSQTNKPGGNAGANTGGGGGGGSHFNSNNKGGEGGSGIVVIRYTPILNYQFLWSTGDTTATINVSPTQTTDYYVTITDGISTCYDTMTVFVNAPVYSFSSDTLAYCDVDTASIDAGAGWSNYAWSTGDSAQLFTTTASGVYHLTVTNQYGCTVSDSVSVGLINTILIQGDTTFCVGDSATIGFGAGGGNTLQTQAGFKLALGLRLINADYNGNAVQLRRSSDNALSDFGFLNGELNVAAIESWAGVSTIYVRTLYDQSGSSRDVVQTANSRQPTLVLTSAYGAPIIHFTNSQQLRYTVNYMFQKPFTLVTAAKTTGSNNGRVFGSYHQNWLHGFWGNRINVAHYEGWRVYPGITSSSGWQVPYIHTMWKANQTNWNFYSNATVQSKSNSNAGTDPRGFTLNGSGNLYELSNVDIMEVIMFDDTLAPVELENVQTSIANRFGITTAYGAPSAGNVGGGGSYEYLWSNGDSTNTIDVSPISTTTYYVTITDGFAECYDSITVTIVDPNFTFTNDTILSCGSDTVNVSAGSTWDNYLWSNGDTTETTSITSSGVYSLTVSNNGQCETWDTVTVSVINTNSGSNDTTICIGDSISINSQIFVSSDTIAFNYTGTDQTFTVPSGVTSINVLAWGAGGGKGGYSSSYAGGSGGFSSGTIAVTPGQQLKVVVGQGGIGQGVGLFTSGGSATYGGGGYGTYGDASGASGGGLTGLFLGAASMTFDASGQSRALLIAGGGGGTCAYSGGGGAGGGTNAGETTGGNGATSTAAGTGTNGDDGSPLKGGNGDASGSQNSGSPDGGGGGGGYFGGEGGFSDARPGGGGSGYLHPTLVSSGVTTTGQNGPSNTSAIPPSTSNALYNTGIGYGAYSSSGSNGGNGKLIISFTGQSAINYNWSTGDTTSTINVSPNTTTAFTVTISDGISSCIDTISITVNDPNFTFTNDTVLATCFADSVTVDAGAVWVGYNWSTGETTQTKVCTATGPYSLTVTDNGGCTSSDTVNVSVINPVLAQGDTMICINTSATVGYNALTNISFLWSNSNTSPSISVSPAVTSNYTVTISDGISSCIDTIAIYIDTISPTVFPHSNVNVYLNSSGQATLSAFIADSATSDNCLIDSIYLSNTSFDCANIGSNPTLLYALDNNGNLDSAQFIVSIIDSIAPVVITQNVTLYLDASGSANLTAIQVDNGSTDNCDIDTITLSNYNFVCADTGVNTITVTVTDASGNAATQSAQITVMDTNSPIVMTQNVTIFLDVNGGATVTPSQVDLSSTDNCAIASMILSDSIFDCSDTVSANSITLSITDISGNSASANALITVLDTISPTAIAQNLTLFLDANGQAIAQASQVDNGSYDNCDVASLSLSDTIFNCADSGINTITLTVFDVSGNSSTATAQLLVVDTTSPSVITQNIIAYLDSSGQVIISWLDLDSASTDNCTIASSILSDSIFDCSDTGSINIVTLTMTDISGNSSSNDAQVVIIDSLPPVVITQNLTVYLDTNGVANITVNQINNGSYDNCGIDTMYLSNYSFDCNSNGLDTIILYVTDVSGNMSQNIAIVTVLETSAPVALAQNVTIYLDSNGSASVSPLVADSGSYDNCGIETYSLSDTTFTCNDVGENTVTFTVSDYSMNTSSVQIIITVLDTIKPVIYSQSPTVYLDANGQAMLNVPQVDSGSYDNCSIGSIFLSDSLFNCGLVGVNDIYLMVSDVNGNIDSSIVSVTVADTIKPLVFAENYQAYLNLAGEFTLGVNLINASATDNCDVDSIYLSSTYFSCAHLGINYVSVYASDVNGNIGTIEIEVEILDTISPIITYCPEDIVSCDSIINYEIPMAEDNCLNVNSVLTNGIESGARFDIGITAIQYTMSDTMGNSVTCDFNVKRSGAPKITISKDTTIFSGSVINLAVETDSVASSYYWTPEDYLDNPNSSNPTATPTESITYRVMVNSIDGCQQEDSVSILVLNEVTVYNAFSPNGDGQNDYLEINGLDYYIDCNVLIVNRLGAKVFESKGYSQPWNGKYKNKDMPVGAYFYFIDTGVPGAETLTGSISLIR